MDEKIKKVVIIAYNFPPVGGAGVQRPVKFVKYLREFGWEPVVLTVANPSVPVIDESLLGDIPDDVAIYKAKTLEPSYAQKQTFASDSKSITSLVKQRIKSIVINYMLPDLQILWWPCLIVKLIQVIRCEKPDCLFVTAPPFSSFLPVVLLGSLFRIPVVVDFRDEWSFTRNTWENATRNKLAVYLDIIFEKYVIRNCSAFTAANMSYVESICNAYQDIDKKKGFVITNGYDEDDFLHADIQRHDAVLNGKINIVYTGTVWKATSLRPFVTALKALLSEDPTIADKITVRIFGRVVDAEKQYLVDEELRELIVLFDYCDHDVIIREIKQADILLVTLSDIPGAHKIITGKAFESMATGKHIFAILPDGETKRIIVDNYDNCTVIYPNEHENICNALRNIICNILEIRKCTGSDVSQFSRRRLTGSLVEVLRLACNVV